MIWEEVVGQSALKEILKETVKKNRVGHAYLFTGEDGFGPLPLALAFAREILVHEKPSAESKVETFNHLDLHFSFPVVSVSGKALSKDYLPSFLALIRESEYINLEDWITELEAANKQLMIGADESEQITAKFQFKSFEGGSKIIIIWHAEKMNLSAANKLLKFIEEPPADTVILMTAPSAVDILPTILSRAQIIEVPAIEEQELINELIEFENIEEEKARQYALQAQGNFAAALQIILHEGSSTEFEEYFVRWVRSAFMVKKKPEFLKDIIIWSRDIAVWSRDKQKSFISYCTEIFRLALMQSYGAPQLVYKTILIENFKWEKFADYIHGANIESILEELSETDFHISRNGNARIVWTDMGIKMTRYLHRSRK